MMNMLQRALNWSSSGWPVFPVSPENKRPLIEEWQLNATTETAFINGWWTDYPEAGVGVVPGLVGCFVVDVDAKNGKDGFATLAELERTHGFETWDSPQQDTPSGGRHLLFRGTAKTSAGVLGPGLDTRGGSHDGGLGYIVAYLEAPPCYPAKCPSLPPELVAKLGEIKQVDENRHEAKVELDLPANVARAKMWLKGVVTPGHGERNHSLFKTACTLKDMGLSLLSIFDAIDEYPHVSGDPPLRDENPEEFNTTIRSAWRNGQLAPGVEAVETGGLDAIAKQIGTLPASQPSSGADQTKRNRTGAGTRRIDPWSVRRSRPSPPWIIRGVVPQGALVGLYGAGGSYKSFLALSMGTAIAGTMDGAERTWAGRDLLSPGPVVYVSGEGSAEPRVRAIEAARKAQVSDNFAIFDGLNLGDLDDCAVFQEALQEAISSHFAGHAPALIIFDTLARAAPNVEENSNKEMGAIVAVLDQLRSAYGCAVMIVHHTPKDNPTLWRGATAVWNALDTALLMVRTGENAATLSVERQKDGAVGAQWRVALREVETGVERDGEAERSLVCDLTPVDVAQAQRIEKQKHAQADAARLHFVTKAVELVLSYPGPISFDQVATHLSSTLQTTAAEIKKTLKGAVAEKGTPLATLHLNGVFYPQAIKENPG